MSRDYDVRKSNKIYVSNLSLSTTEDDLRRVFQKYGTIKDITLKQKETITFAFVEYDSVSEAEEAINECHGKQIAGSEVKVYFAKGGNDRRGGFQDRGRGREGGYQGRNFDGPPRRDFGDRPRGCFNCGEEGHMIKDCPKPKKPREFNNREGGFERRPYENREGDRSYGDNDRRGGFQSRGYGDRERGGYRGGEGGYRGGDRGGDRRGGYGRRDRRSSSGSRSRSNGDRRGGHRAPRSPSSGSR